MRVSLLSSAFTSYLASKIPCNPLYYTWTREHVIPKSIISNRRITEDPRNIIPMPRKLNNHRSNRPYTTRWTDGYLVYACDNCPHPGFCRGSMVLSEHGAHPPDILKGPIARSVLYTIDQYPQYARDITMKVLTYKTAMLWNDIYPMSKPEIEWIRSLE
jgi:endonuclease I